MSESYILHQLKKFRNQIEGDLLKDYSSRILYATDASAYRELPLAVIKPRNKEDIRKLVLFAGKHGVSLIPRGAGTSLAGQVVGNGIVVDVTRYLNKIIEINPEERWVRVEPGVVLDELNIALARHNLFFGPETSSSNRCVIGGMVGNNSCGAHSLIYGSTRDHTLEIEAILSDGSMVKFKALSKEEFQQKQIGETLENKLYRNITDILSLPLNKEEIRKEYPDPMVKRRNTGYAIDLLLESEPFSESDVRFNFCKLLAGSEGTLAFITEIKLNLVPLPPKVKGLICVHFNSLEEAFQANLIALKYMPGAVELMDNVILQQTKNNLEQARNRFFVKGDPAAILIIEWARETKEEIDDVAEKMELDMRGAGFGYHFPRIFGSDISRVWALRKAGLGVLSNIAGDAKPVSLVEDTAVNPKVLPNYLAEFQQLLDRYGLKAVYHAHIATGELHLRPVLNLKDPKDVELFHTIAFETAKLVKKYRGSLSGEHGDGRLRGEFIPLMIGQHNYNLLKEIKQTWDPNNIFNPGKIIDTPSMKTNLRYDPGKKTRKIRTYFNFSDDQGVMRAVEKCNGSGDCRKTEIIGGTMCPSFMATRNEKNSTRARANILREFLTLSPKKNPFDHSEIYDIMDLCVSCKGCKSECPSSVDMARYKAEFLQHWWDKHGIPLRTRAVAYISSLNRIGMLFPAITNYLFTNKFIANLFKRVLGIAPKRSIPLLYRYTLSRWLKRNKHKLLPHRKPIGSVYLFIDEFTEYNDTEIGIKAVELLTRLGYEVKIAVHKESGRAFISKGLIRKAARLANFNVTTFKNIIDAQTPLVGIEPSGILSFRDEYPDLVDPELRPEAKLLAQNALMFDEFFEKEIKAGKISRDLFTMEHRKIKLHGHCHQKSLASIEPTKVMLSLPENFQVEEIKSGCCGMAGSFGYETEHYELSMQIGELVLFPEVRKASTEVIIAAPGTSCRHQIKDGTGRTAYHPIEIMYQALLKK